MPALGDYVTYTTPADVPFLEVEIAVAANSTRYALDDERWIAQARDLHNDLRANVPGYRVKSDAVPGTMGSVDTVILALGSAGAFTAAVQCFKAWLARDRSRSIEVTWTLDGREHRMTVKGDAVDLDLLRSIMDDPDGAPWRADTEHS